MEIIFETSRLRVRRFLETDLQNLLALDSDPEVVRYVGDGQVRTPEETRATLSRIRSRYEEWKVYGVWAAEVRSTGEFIGWVSLKPLPNTSEIEVGYRLLRRQWGAGYATEAATAARTHGFEHVGLERIVAITDPRNLASRKVLTKSGFRYVGDRPYGAEPERPEKLVCWFESLRGG